LQISPWRSGIENPASFGVVLTGGGSLLKNAASLGEEILDAQVKIGIPKGLSGVVDVAASPIYATAIGLVQHPTLSHEKYDPVHRRSASMGKLVENIGGWFRGFF
jgi:cell division protein FtsA